MVGSMPPAAASCTAQKSAAPRATPAGSRYRFAGYRHFCAPNLRFRQLYQPAFADYYDFSMLPR